MIGKDELARGTIVPDNEYVRFVNLILRMTCTPFEHWSFIQNRTEAFYSALYTKNGGGHIYMDLGNGLFYIDMNGRFFTNAGGLIYWWNNHQRKGAVMPKVDSDLVPKSRTKIMMVQVRNSLDKLESII